MKLAQRCNVDEAVIVVAQGFGVPQLKAAKASHQLPALRLLPLQPAKQLANVMGTADVLVATIEADAGTFAVPSKVLSYLCAGRPILLAAPKENLAARTVLRANAGIVVSPDDEAGFMAAADRLRSDPQLCGQFGANGREYAERVFDLGRIADRFETVLLMTGRQAVPTTQRTAAVEVDLALAE
jgi:colanic acid biosynthesis glycosyl transferase WcaI